MEHETNILRLYLMESFELVGYFSPVCMKQKPSFINNLIIGFSNWIKPSILYFKIWTKFRNFAFMFVQKVIHTDNNQVIYFLKDISFKLKFVKKSQTCFKNMFIIKSPCTFTRRERTASKLLVSIHRIQPNENHF